MFIKNNAYETETNIWSILVKHKVISGHGACSIEELKIITRYMPDYVLEHIQSYSLATSNYKIAAADEVMERTLLGTTVLDLEKEGLCG